jgi:eukaryotic-like serine/threonine-protein kinase
MTLHLLAPGTMLSGRYQVADVIGESDLSRVYSAQDLRGQAQVALKIFDSSIMSRVAALSEYQAQARQASGLGVEGIARAYDFGIDANSGVPFSTAERISWVSLDRRVSAHGPLGASDLSRALSVMARALDAAHAARIVHRDLKPQNVFISPDNPEWVRITDFGVSAVRRGAAEAMGWGGPPGYTPPDAVDAAAPGTPGVDLFALGVIAFFALTRATPFRSLRHPVFDPTAHWAELNQPLNPISDRAREIGVALDPAFDPWFARALALAPQDRFGSAGEMARELSVIAELVSARGGGGPRSMPGIAAAIAQPLVFQPEPSPASLGLPYAPTAPVGTPPAAAAPVSAEPRSAPSPTVASSAAEPVAASSQKSSRLPLFIGLGVLLFAGLAFAGYQVLGSSKAGDEAKAAPEPSAAVSASAAPAAPAPSSAAVASSDVAAPAQPARALFSCQPQACEWIVCDGKTLTGFSQEIEVTAGPHECSASRFGFGSKSLTFSAAPGQVTTVVFDLPPLPPSAKQKAAAAPSTTAKPAATSAPVTKPATKPAATPVTKPAATPVTKPAATATTKTPVTTSTKKKKCSTFLGCK